MHTARWTWDKRTVVRFPSECSAKISKSKCNLKHSSIHYHYANIRSWSVGINSWWHQFSNRAIIPLQRKREQEDDMINSVSGTPQTVKNNEENMVETWHLCLFHVFTWGTVQSWDKILYWLYTLLGDFFFSCSASQSIYCFSRNTQQYPPNHSYIKIHLNVKFIHSTQKKTYKTDKNSKVIWHECYTLAEYCTFNIQLAKIVLHIKVFIVNDHVMFHQDSI